MIELEIAVVGARTPLRVELAQMLCLLGSGPSCDVRVAGLPERLAVIQREADVLSVKPVGDSQSLTLGPGGRVELPEVVLHWPVATDVIEPERLDGTRIRDALADVESPIQAVAAFLREIVTSVEADTGVVILREADGYAIAAAEDRRGRDLNGANSLLSDSIVRAVLDRAVTVQIDRVDEDSTYADIPSVTMLGLQSILCVPMEMQGAVLGAVFLGRAGLDSPFGERLAQDLGLVASMAVPLLVQLRRFGDGTVPARDSFVGEDSQMLELQDLIKRVGPSDLSVLICGETGTGKELVARALHDASHRAAEQMVAINCSAVPESLMEAELFGYRKGSFTGAVRDRQGKIEIAHRSTLFLDEIGDMPFSMQAALLRVLENQQVTRIGENQLREVDFRVLAATHKNLPQEVSAGRFRQDLFFRLSEFTIDVPPLVSRGRDILLLAQLFLRQMERQLGVPSRRIGPQAAERLLTHTWPGNVRELRASIRRAAILCDGVEIQPEHLRLDAGTTVRTRDSSEAQLASRPCDVGVNDVLSDEDALAASVVFTPSDSAQTDDPQIKPLAQARDEFVVAYVREAIRARNGDREQAARDLGVSIRSLYRYLSGS